MNTKILDYLSQGIEKVLFLKNALFYVFFIVNCFYKNE